MTLRIEFLGTGDTFASGGRSHSCILLTGSRGRILLDCGGSSLPAIKRACDPETIDAVAVSHLHGDHFGGLTYLAMEQKWAPRRRRLTFAGPPSLEGRFHQVMRSLYADFYDTPLPYELAFAVLSATPQNLGAAQVSAHPVTHVPSSEPHGLRVKIEGRLVAYSGDAVWTDDLPALAAGADLFICETTTFSPGNPVHLSASELVAHRQLLKCDRVIATHLGPDSLANLDRFGVEHAEDGMELEL